MDLQSKFGLYCITAQTLNIGQFISRWEGITNRLLKKLDMCLWNTDAPGGNNVKYGKISKSYILTPPHPQGHGMSVKREEPIDELTVQVWLLYH